MERNEALTLIQIDTKTFNPDILYAFDSYDEGTALGKEHAHDFVELSIILDGEATYHVHHHRYHATKGCVMLYHPGTPHQHIQEEHTYSHQLHIGLNNVTFEGLKRNYLPFETTFIELKHEQAIFLDLCQAILIEKNERALGYELMIKSLIMKLLVMLLRQGNVIENTEMMTSLTDRSYQDKERIVNNIIYYLETHHAQDITLDSLAETMYISPNYLSKVFKEVTKDSPINYLIQIRLNRAALLLQNNQLTIKEVAKRVGYDDPFYFSKLFKKYYGVSPSHYQTETFSPFDIPSTPPSDL